jgi:hypothetical protein
MRDIIAQNGGGLAGGAGCQPEVGPGLVYHLVYHGDRFLPLVSVSTFFWHKENPLI